MYCVVRGEKHFTLLPPSDVLFLYEQEYPQGRYRRARKEGPGGGGGFEVEMEEGTVPWIPVGECVIFCFLRGISPFNIKGMDGGGGRKGGGRDEERKKGVTT